MGDGPARQSFPSSLLVPMIGAVILFRPRATAIWATFTPSFLASSSTLTRSKHSPDEGRCGDVTNRCTTASDHPSWGRLDSRDFLCGLGRLRVRSTQAMPLRASWDLARESEEHLDYVW